MKKKLDREEEVCFSSASFGSTTVICSFFISFPSEILQGVDFVFLLVELPLYSLNKSEKHEPK